MKLLKTLLLSALSFIALPAFAQDLPPIPERNADQILAGQPEVRSRGNLARYFNDPARAARLKVLAEGIMDAAITSNILPGGNERMVVKVWRDWVSGSDETDARALAFLKVSYPLVGARKAEVIKFVKTRENYDAAKAAGWVVEGTPFLPDFRAGVIELACRFADYEFIDTFSRAGALQAPLTPQHYMEFLQWKSAQLATDRQRYDYLQNELTNLMMSRVADPNNNAFEVVINKASDLIYLRMRRAQTLEQATP